MGSSPTTIPSHLSGIAAIDRHQSDLVDRRKSCKKLELTGESRSLTRFCWVQTQTDDNRTVQTLVTCSGNVQLPLPLSTVAAERWTNQLGKSHCVPLPEYSLLHLGTGLAQHKKNKTMQHKTNKKKTIKNKREKKSCVPI